VAAGGVRSPALWGALGAAVGVLLANQVGALVVLLVYLQVGSWCWRRAEQLGLDALARLTPYLPGNAGTSRSTTSRPAHWRALASRTSWSRSWRA
jgi:hypothetical protein